MSTPRRILIRAGHVIAFDGRGHRLLRDGAVVLEGGRIVDVGANLDTVTTIPKRALTTHLTVLSPDKLHAVERARRFALSL
jgi:mRNA-degrading endonuclease toxin of MazEF toxin-antitoxin module